MLNDSKGHWPRRRKVLLGLLVFALGLAGVLALGLFPQEPVRRLVESQLRAVLGPERRIGRLHVVPGRLQAELQDLVIDAPGYRLEVPHARVGVSLALVLGRAVSLSFLEADSPRLVLRPTPETAPVEPASNET